MFPGVNPRQMQQMMKQMGIKQVDIDGVERVEVICADRKYIIAPAQVSKVNMMGQHTWQVVGEATEESLDTAADISEEDIKTVAEQAKVSEEEARRAIEEADGDLAVAIMKLQEASD